MKKDKHNSTDVSRYERLEISIVYKIGKLLQYIFDLFHLYFPLLFPKNYTTEKYGASYVFANIFQASQEFFVLIPLRI